MGNRGCRMEGGRLSDSPFVSLSRDGGGGAVTLILACLALSGETSPPCFTITASSSSYDARMAFRPSRSRPKSDTWPPQGGRKVEGQLWVCSPISTIFQFSGSPVFRFNFYPALGSPAIGCGFRSGLSGADSCRFRMLPRHLRLSQILPQTRHLAHSLPAPALCRCQETATESPTKKQIACQPTATSPPISAAPAATSARGLTRSFLRTWLPAVLLSPPSTA